MRPVADPVFPRQRDINPIFVKKKNYMKTKEIASLEQTIDLPMASSLGYNFERMNKSIQSKISLCALQVSISG